MELAKLSFECLQGWRFLFGHLSKCLDTLFVIFFFCFPCCCFGVSLVASHVTHCPLAVRLSEQSLAVSSLHPSMRQPKMARKSVLPLPHFLQSWFYPQAAPRRGVTVPSTGCCTCLCMSEKVELLSTENISRVAEGKCISPGAGSGAQNRAFLSPRNTG